MSVERADRLFRRAFGEAPMVVASAPGRVNLIGEHTDYNGGQVLPIAIGVRTWIALSAARDGSSRAVSDGRAEGRFVLGSERPAGKWWDYIHGTLREVRLLGVDVPEVMVAVVSDVPAGAGLSSSAALEVATACAALALTVHGRERWDAVAGAAHRAETQFVGVACGVMDQTVSAYAEAGHALRIWCDSGRREHVPFDRSVLIVDTATPRRLRGSAFNTRRAECEAALEALRAVAPSLTALARATLESLDRVTLPAVERRRARHVITETGRVEQFAAALEAGEPLGALLLASHRSLREDYECSTPELDWVVEESMRMAGIEGARLTGAGWGGCAIVIGDEEALRALGEPLAARFAERWGRPARTWRSRAGAGASIDFMHGAGAIPLGL